MMGQKYLKKLNTKHKTIQKKVWKGPNIQAIEIWRHCSHQQNKTIRFQAALKQDRRLCPISPQTPQRTLFLSLGTSSYKLRIRCYSIYILYDSPMPANNFTGQVLYRLIFLHIFHFTLHGKLFKAKTHSFQISMCPFY